MWKKKWTFSIICDTILITMSEISLEKWGVFVSETNVMLISKYYNAFSILKLNFFTKSGPNMFSLVVFSFFHTISL